MEAFDLSKIRTRQPHKRRCKTGYIGVDTLPATAPQLLLASMVAGRHFRAWSIAAWWQLFADYLPGSINLLSKLIDRQFCHTRFTWCSLAAHPVAMRKSLMSYLVLVLVLPW